MFGCGDESVVVGRQRCHWKASKTAAMTATLLALGAASAQARIAVNTLVDETTPGDGHCSLREAIAAADGNRSPDCHGNARLITLPAGTYNLTPGRELFLAAGAHVEIRGQSRNPRQTVINAGDGNGHTGRVIQVVAGARVAMFGLTIEGGRTEDGAGGSGLPGGVGGPGGSGAGLYSAGTVSLTSVRVVHNFAGTGGVGVCCTAAYVPTGAAGGSGGAGGGIFNAGTLTVTTTMVSGNGAGAGGTSQRLDSGPGPYFCAHGGPGGPGGSGGGIFNSGTLTTTAARIVGNAAGAGGGGAIGVCQTHVLGVEYLGSAGAGGAGGGIFNSGTLRSTETTITANLAGVGGPGGSCDTGILCFSSGTGAPGGGGGGLNNGGTATVTKTTVASNLAGRGGTPNINTGVGLGPILPGGGGGPGGSGGGILNSGTVSVTASTLSGNGAGRGSDGSTASDGGPGGSGGGIYDNGTARLTNDTIAADSAGAGGDGGDGIDWLAPSSPGYLVGAGGVAGSGGGIEAERYSTMFLVATTVTQNATGTPGAGGAATGTGDAGPAGASGTGGGIDSSGARTAETSTLVAANSSPSCSGPVTDNGYNLGFSDSSCPGIHADPMLQPLGRYGGPTQTVALGTGSAAIDRVRAGRSCPATDQRGVRRPRGRRGLCDIGSFESSLRGDRG